MKTLNMQPRVLVLATEFYAHESASGYEFTLRGACYERLTRLLYPLERGVSRSAPQRHPES
jgi:hypothetical protein